MSTNPFKSWNQFTERMLKPVAGPIDNDPVAKLFCLQQEGDILDYVNEFEALRNQVTGIDEKNLIKVFYNGLNPEMKEVTRMKEPVSLTSHKLAVLKMQSTSFCKVMGSAAGGETQRGYQHHSHSVRPTSFTPKQSGDKPRLEAGSNKENAVQQKPALRPRQQYTDAKLDRMRKDKVFFKCKAPWSPDHKMECPNRMLRVLTMINGLELEVMDSYEEEGLQEQPNQQVLHTLSLNYYLGIDSQDYEDERFYQ